MTVKITHHYKNSKGNWENQFFIFKNVIEIETEYQPQNGNSYWLHIYQDNGNPQGEYYEIDKNLDYFDIIQIK